MVSKIVLSKTAKMANINVSQIPPQKVIICFPKACLNVTIIVSYFTLILFMGLQLIILIFFDRIKCWHDNRGH